MQKKRLLFMLLAFFCVLAFTNANSVNGKRVEMTRLAILSFYKAYLSENLDVRKGDSLARTFLTPEMYERLRQLNELTDFDHLIRAQDVTENAYRTLSCRHIKGNWYGVSWRFSSSDSLTFIPLKVRYVKSRPYICDVIPVWDNWGLSEKKLDVRKDSKQHFEHFLSKLVAVKQVDILAFGDTIIEPNLTDVAFQPYLTQISAQLNKRKDCAWQGGGYMKKGDVVWVFLQAHLLDYNDGYSKWFMEPMLTKYFVATYTKDGKLLDSQCVGNSDGVYRFDVDGYNGKSFLVSQFVMDDPAMTHDYKGLDYTVQRSKVTINFKGEVKMKHQGGYKQHVPAKELASNPPLSFVDFLKNFRRWDKKEFDDSLFVYSKTNSFLASSSLLKLFPNEKICKKCWPKDLSWTPCCYIETKRSFLCFMLMDCSFPKKDEARYIDYVIAVFGKDGQFKKLVNAQHWEYDDIDRKIDVKALERLLSQLVQQES